MVTDEEELFLMANLSPRLTGLPFVVWISPRGNARHDVQVKVSPGPKAVPSEMLTVGIRPTVHVIEEDLKAEDLALLTRWVELNRDVLVRFWEGDIEYTADALALLQGV